jgi:hypothetical protein
VWNFYFLPGLTFLHMWEAHKISSTLPWPTSTRVKFVFEKAPTAEKKRELMSITDPPQREFHFSAFIRFVSLRQIIERPWTSLSDIFLSLAAYIEFHHTQFFIYRFNSDIIMNLYWGRKKEKIIGTLAMYLFISFFSSQSSFSLSRFYSLFFRVYVNCMVCDRATMIREWGQRTFRNSILIVKRKTLNWVTTFLLNRG